MWNEVVAEKKACEKAEKESRELFQKVIYQRERIEKLKNHNEHADFEEIDENLMDIVGNNEGLPEKEQFSVEQAKDFLYTFGKNKAAIVYAEHGVDPVNLAFIVHNVAKSQEKFLSEKLDGKAYLIDINRRLFDDAKSHLKDSIGKQDSVGLAYTAVQNAEKILEFTDCSPEEKQEKLAEINKFLVGALLPKLKRLSFQGLVSEFEDVRSKIYEAMDKAKSPAELQEKAKGKIDIYRGRCYNAYFKSHCALFALNLLSAAELEKVVEAHNRVFEELNLSEEDIKANKLKTRAAFNSNTYRIGMNQLLASVDPAARNGKPGPSEKEAKDIVERVKRYAGFAELTQEEKEGTNDALKRIGEFYGWYSIFEGLNLLEEKQEDFDSETYRVVIDRLLTSVDPAARNGNPVPPEKEAKEIADKVKSYVQQAGLKPAERKGVVKALRRIDSFYNGHRQNFGDRNGRNQMYKNPLYDRRARQLTKKHR
jgi:hypothetical protein